MDDYSLLPVLVLAIVVGLSQIGLAVIAIAAHDEPPPSIYWRLTLLITSAPLVGVGWLSLQIFDLIDVLVAMCWVSMSISGTASVLAAGLTILGTLRRPAQRARHRRES